MRKRQERVENKDQTSVCLGEYDTWKDIRFVLTVRQLFSLYKGKQSSDKINISLVSIN